MRDIKNVSPVRFYAESCVNPALRRILRESHAFRAYPTQWCAKQTRDVARTSCEMRAPNDVTFVPICGEQKTISRD
jgi:hypothetical protein